MIFVRPAGGQVIVQVKIEDGVGGYKVRLVDVGEFEEYEVLGKGGCLKLGETRAQFLFVWWLCRCDGRQGHGVIFR